jgi:hypothetical protein
MMRDNPPCRLVRISADGRPFTDQFRCDAFASRRPRIPGREKGLLEMARATRQADHCDVQSSLASSRELIVRARKGSRAIRQ